MNQNLNVLLVEDDLIDVMNVKRAFKKSQMHHTLSIAENGAVGWNMLTGSDQVKAIDRPHIILLDINMPKMNGLEFLRKIRSSDLLKDITVFIMTTSDKHSDILEAHKLNIAGYILKPLNLDQYLDKIIRLKQYWEICEFPPHTNLSL